MVRTCARTECLVSVVLWKPFFALVWAKSPVQQIINGVAGTSVCAWCSEVRESVVSYLLSNAALVRVLLQIFKCAHARTRWRCIFMDQNEEATCKLREMVKFMSLFGPKRQPAVTCCSSLKVLNRAGCQKVRCFLGEEYRKTQTLNTHRGGHIDDWITLVCYEDLQTTNSATEIEPAH